MKTKNNEELDTMTLEELAAYGAEVTGARDAAKAAGDGEARTRLREHQLEVNQRIAARTGERNRALPETARMTVIRPRGGA